MMDRANEAKKPRIGVYICQCGSNIAATVDTQAVAQFAEALRGSPWASRTSLYQVYEVVASLKEELDDPDVSELAELVQRAARMWRPAVR